MRLLISLLLVRAAALALSVPERLRVGGMRLRSRPLKPEVRAQAANGDYLDSLDVSGGGAGEEGFFMRNRTPLLFGALVTQKVLADVVTDYTRRQGAYSGATVSMLSEVAKFPVLMVAIAAFAGGPKRWWPTVKRAATDTPLKIAWIAGAYAAQNVLYFAALGRISAASYQVLSQSKMIFTASLAVAMLGERLGARQVLALAALLAGSILVQLAEMGAGAAVAGGRSAEALLGGGFAVLGALLSAVPNVYYEKLLKTPGEDEWARNIQVTFWIFAWIAASQLQSSVAAFKAGVSTLAPFSSAGSFCSALLGSMEGITPGVWLVVALKSLNGLLIPATLKYAGNIVYLYAKPTSIVATALATAAYTGVVPPASFVAGAALVIWSMLSYKK